MDRMLSAPGPVWSRRITEWSLLAALILVLVWFFAHQFREVQGQAEAAAVKSTLGALRVAFVIDQVHAGMVSNSSLPQTKRRNPFALLQTPPPNYWGETAGDNASGAPAGSWSFNAVCACIAYVPMDDQWLSSPSGDLVAYFQIKDPGSGPLQLVRKELYLWKGNVLD